ncbi:Pentatricopeptide repeat-containing protein [Vitis vinifera]|uniref:Pentatricopeptide repeat-containing protein n=1 Tax=Vitis vinifera TaxID=29760 RepID=A0A438IXU9_VITVI|nr:Pentatricopeptide repeat-containing protein [Vitis vinifera]
MYSKCGAIEMAMEVFSRMPVKSVASWNCMINGLAMNGGGSAAIGLFKEMQASGLGPNSATFLGVLHACSHGGLVNEALEYFSCMRELYGIETNVKHYGCMVDLYGRAGKLEKAVDVIRTMPMKPDIVIWGALLGGCKKHDNAKLGELVGAQIMKLQPHKVSGCSSLSDMYAMDGRWEDVISVRRMMLDMYVGREPGCSTLT